MPQAEARGERARGVVSVAVTSYENRTISSSAPLALAREALVALRCATVRGEEEREEEERGRCYQCLSVWNVARAHLACWRHGLKAHRYLRYSTDAKGREIVGKAQFRLFDVRWLVESKVPAE